MYVRKQAGEPTIQVPDLFDNFFDIPNPRKRPVMTCDRVKEKVLRIIIAGNLPFSIAEPGEFVDLLNDAYPDCPPPTRKAIMDHLKAKAMLTKLKLKESLAKNDSKISLALDVWTTRTNLSFLGTFLLILNGLGFSDPIQCVAGVCTTPLQFIYFPIQANMCSHYWALDRQSLQTSTRTPCVHTSGRETPWRGSLNCCHGHT